MPNGTIVDNLSCLRKDNTGYDIKQLFIGGEGTLGIVSKVAMAVPRRPSSVQLAFVAVDSFASVLKVMHRARSELGEILSALEFQDRESVDHVLDHLSSARDPLSEARPFYMIIETSGNCAGSDLERLEKFLMSSIESGDISDGTIAQDTTQMQELWALRESIAASLSSMGAVYKYDISVPVDSMYHVVEQMRERLNGLIRPEFVTG